MGIDQMPNFKTERTAQAAVDYLVIIGEEGDGGV